MCHDVPVIQSNTLRLIGIDEVPNYPMYVSEGWLVQFNGTNFVPGLINIYYGPDTSPKKYLCRLVNVGSTGQAGGASETTMVTCSLSAVEDTDYFQNMYFIVSIGRTTLPGAAIDPINQMIDSNRGLDALIYGVGGASPEISECDWV